MKSCFVENEQKAYDIVKLYHTQTKDISEEEQIVRALTVLDNEIQKKEIKTHCFLNDISRDDRQNESLLWIQNYGESFRVYLNTLKIIFLALKANSIDINEISFEYFCHFKDRMNKYRAFLNIIHN